jgi:hypothetical protein
MTKKLQSAQMRKKGSDSPANEKDLPTKPLSGLAWYREMYDRDLSDRKQKLEIRLLEAQLNAGQAAADSTSKIQFADIGVALDRGQLCSIVVDEMKRLKNMRGGRGLTMLEIEAAHPNLKVWSLVQTLSDETRDTFQHFNQWGPAVGFARKLLGEHFDKSPTTIRNWIKQYRAKLKK